MLKNNFISLLDQTFSGANELFSSLSREKDGHEKWIDFIAAFLHNYLIGPMLRQGFTVKHEK